MVKTQHMSVLTIAELRTSVPDVQHLHAVVAAHATGDRVLWANPIPRLLLIQAASAVVLPVRDARRTESAPLVTPPTGAHVEVSLIAAPTKSVHRSGARGIRRPLPPDGWAGWLRRKTSGALDLEWVRADPAGVRSGRRSGRRITFTRVAYHATGTVTDAAALSTLQRIGVGTGKGYGCGLLLVREVTP